MHHSLYTQSRLGQKRAPLKPASWESHEHKTSERASNTNTLLCLNLLLQSVNRVGLHDGLRWLRRDLHLLAEDVPHSCLCCWFCASLDPAQTWNREEAGLLHLLGCNVHQAVEDLRTLLHLQAMLVGNGLQESSLGHGLCGCLHCLHGGHLAGKTKCRIKIQRFFC